MSKLRIIWWLVAVASGAVALAFAAGGAGKLSVAFLLPTALAVYYGWDS